MSQENGFDVVCISLPRREESAKPLRLTAAGVASRAGLNLDQADDINTALDELFRLFLTGSSSEDDFEVRFEIRPGQLRVVASGIAQDLFDDSKRINRYSRFILEKVADEVEEVASRNGGFDVVIAKNIQS